jgi:hypothetical protein
MKLKETIKQNEQNFMYTTSKEWGNLDDASSIFEDGYYEIYNRDVVKENQSIANDKLSSDNKHYEEYDIDVDVKYFQNMKKIKTSLYKPYHIVKKPHIL